MITSNYFLSEDLAFDVAGPAGQVTVAINDQGLYTLSTDPTYAAPLGVALEEAARRTAGPAGHLDLDTTTIDVGDLLDFLFPHAEPFTRNLTELLNGVAAELGWETFQPRDVEIFRLAITDLLPAGLTPRFVIPGDAEWPAQLNDLDGVEVCGSPRSWRVSGYAASGTDAAVDCS